MTINLFVHGLMYSYYALKVSRHHSTLLLLFIVPNPISYVTKWDFLLK